MKYLGHEMSGERYARISRAHADLCEAIRLAGEGPLNAAQAASREIWTQHGARPWTASDLAAERAAMQAAREAHPTYAEWIHLSAELDRRIATNRAQGRPLLAFSDSDWG